MNQKLSIEEITRLRSVFINFKSVIKENLKKECGDDYNRLSANDIHNLEYHSMYKVISQSQLTQHLSEKQKREIVGSFYDDKEK